MRSLVAISFLVSYVLAGCSMSNREPTGGVKNDPSAASAVGTTTLEAFVNSWCGSGTLTNLRQLDAAEYLVSADMPSWLNIKSENNRAVWGNEFGGKQKEMIDGLKEGPMFNAMFPAGKMILADFSSGSGCRNTLVAIDALAVAYLKKLKDASSANALTCEKKSQGGFHELAIKAPGIDAVFGQIQEDDDPPSRCDTTLAQVLVGHESTGTLTVSSTHNADTEIENVSLFDFELRSYILEADGSAQFLRADGAFKIFYSNFSAMFGRRMQYGSEDAVRGP